MSVFFYVLALFFLLPLHFLGTCYCRDLFLLLECLFSNNGDDDDELHCTLVDQWKGFWANVHGDFFQEFSPSIHSYRRNRVRFNDYFMLTRCPIKSWLCSQFPIKSFLSSQSILEKVVDAHKVYIFMFTKCSIKSYLWSQSVLWKVVYVDKVFYKKLLMFTKCFIKSCLYSQSVLWKLFMPTKCSIKSYLCSQSVYKNLFMLTKYSIKSCLCSQSVR